MRWPFGAERITREIATGRRERRQERLIRCILLLVFSVLAIIVVEIGLRASGHRPSVPTPDRAELWSYHPTLGWQHRPGQSGVFELAATRVEVSHNSKGLRDREVPYAPAAGEKRILLLGDSFAWGFGVERTEGFGEQLETMLAGVEVINAGVSGYSTDQQLLWLQSEGRKYRPDLVLLLLSGNDDEGNQRRTTYLVYPKPFFVLSSDGELDLHNVPVPRPSVVRRLLWRGCTASALVNVLVGRLSVLGKRRSTGAAAGDRGTASPPPFALTLRLIEKMRAEAAAHGARFAIVATGMFWPAQNGGSFTDLLDAIRELKIETLDVEANAGFDGERMRLPHDGHWNRHGHAFAAGLAVDLITRRRLLASESTSGSAGPPLRRP